MRWTLALASLLLLTAGCIESQATEPRTPPSTSTEEGHNETGEPGGVVSNGTRVDTAWWWNGNSGTDHDIENVRVVAPPGQVGILRAQVDWAESMHVSCPNVTGEYPSCGMIAFKGTFDQVACSWRSHQVATTYVYGLDSYNSESAPTAQTIPGSGWLLFWHPPDSEFRVGTDRGSQVRYTTLNFTDSGLRLREHSQHMGSEPLAMSESGFLVADYRHTGQASASAQQPGIDVAHKGTDCGSTSSDGFLGVQTATEWRGWVSEGTTVTPRPPDVGSGDDRIDWILIAGTINDDWEYETYESNLP